MLFHLERNFSAALHVVYSFLPKLAAAWEMHCIWTAFFIRNSTEAHALVLVDAPSLMIPVTESKGRPTACTDVTIAFANEDETAMRASVEYNT